MQKELEDYLNEAGLQFVDFGIGEKFSDDLKMLLETSPVAKENIIMSEMPYKLKEILLHNNFSNKDIYKLVFRMDEVVKFLHDEIGADWTGVYKKLDTKTGLALVKLMHRGFASRIEFPLTKKFAEHSNNSIVGLTGKAILVNSVKKHIQEGKPYYKSDRKVQSELCFPIFSKDKKVIGIIDLESFKEDFFDDEKIIKVAAACVLLSDKL